MYEVLKVIITVCHVRKPDTLQTFFILASFFLCFSNKLNVQDVLNFVVT